MTKKLKTFSAVHCRRKFHNWDITDYFSDLTARDLKNTGQKEKWKALFWQQICTEYDSQNLFNYLMTVGKKRWSPTFLEMVSYWLKDEQKHTEGFARIYSMLYGD